MLKTGGRLFLTTPNKDAPLPPLERLPLSRFTSNPVPSSTYATATRLASSRPSGNSWIPGNQAHHLRGPAHRATQGFVLMAHLVVRRAKGQTSWTWAEVEDDGDSLALRLYARVFPPLLALARIGNVRESGGSSVLIEASRRATER